MPSLNKVFLMGNLTRDPDFRSTAGGKSIVEFAMAMNRQRANANGQQTTETCYITVTTFGKTAELCRQYLAKGSPVLVEGRLQFDQWEDRNSGQKRQKHTVVAENVTFLGGGGGNSGKLPASNSVQRETRRTYSQQDEPPAMPPMDGGAETMIDDTPF